MGWGKGERFLTDGRPNGKPYDIVRDKPLINDSRLFSQFADLYPATEEKIRAFANRYGFLGESEEIRITPPSHDSFVGENLFLWVREIDAMRQTRDLWWLLKHKDHEALAKVITWGISSQGKSFVRVQFSKKRKGQGSSICRYDAQHRWVKGDVIAPGWYHVQNEINQHIGNGRVSPRLVRDEGIGTLSLYCVPQNLIGALWLQFAQSVAKGQDLLQCAYCQKPFLIGGGAKNSHAQYCKATCRNMAWRKRAASLPQGKIKQQPPTRKRKSPDCLS